MIRTHLEALEHLWQTGDEDGAWEVAQRDEGLLPHVTKEAWLDFAYEKLWENL